MIADFNIQNSFTTNSVRRKIISDEFGVGLYYDI